MQNQRQISCHTLIKVLEGKGLVSLLLQAVALKKWRERSVWQMVEFYSSGFIFLLSSSQPPLSILCIGNHIQKRLFYNLATYEHKLIT